MRTFGVERYHVDNSKKATVIKFKLNTLARPAANCCRFTADSL